MQKGKNEYFSGYMRQLDKFGIQEKAGEDVKLTKGLIEVRLDDAEERLEKYRACQKLMEGEGLSQLSLTDANADL